MTEHRANTYDDEDMKQILEEIEGLEGDKVTARAEAAGICAGISKKIGNAKGRAKDIGIPLVVLSGLLKTRKLERQIAAVADGISDEYAEVFEDAVGQFSFLAPVDDEPEAETVAQAAARKRKAKADANEAQEQAEGAAALDELTKH